MNPIQLHPQILLLSTLGTGCLGLSSSSLYTAEELTSLKGHATRYGLFGWASLFYLAFVVLTGLSFTLYQEDMFEPSKSIRQTMDQHVSRKMTSLDQDEQVTWLTLIACFILIMCGIWAAYSYVQHGSLGLFATIGLSCGFILLGFLGSMTNMHVTSINSLKLILSLIGSLAMVSSVLVGPWQHKEHLSFVSGPLYAFGFLLFNLGNSLLVFA